MLGVERDSNGWKAHALELWVESRASASLMTCASGPTASPAWVSSRMLKETDVWRAACGTERLSTE